MMIQSMLNLIYSEFSRAPSPKQNCGGDEMTEIVTTILLFLSISVFSGHAFEAYREWSN
jgi:hypothetical protein